MNSDSLPSDSLSSVLTANTTIRSVVAMSLVQVAITVLILRAMGRTWWCQSQDFAIWIVSASSSHTSQHLFDPYTLTHIAHGFFFCGLFAILMPRLAVGYRFTLALAIECLWEIVENTPFIINRYREATAALGYEGDSIANSIADIAACAAGFLFAARFGWRVTLVIFIFFEVTLLLTIRDSLILNVIMLCFPIDAIRHWQLGVVEVTQPGT
jgi:hypothetical protein